MIVAVVLTMALVQPLDSGVSVSAQLRMATSIDGSAAAVDQRGAEPPSGSSPGERQRLQDAASVPRDGSPTGDDDHSAVERLSHSREARRHERSREGLLQELEGFGRHTTGGLAGPTYVVTNLRDSGAGSLRAGVEADGARWIEFADELSGTIALDSDIRVRGSKTIDGRGADITLAHGGLQVVGDNVIISDLRFVNTKDDAVGFYGGRRNGWVHHSTFIGREDWQQDGAIDIADRSTDITVSWNRFENWDKTSLATREFFSGEPVTSSATKVRVTYHHNHFKASRQRQPQVRTALLHSYNNWFEHYGRPGTGVATQACNYAEVLSEHNIYDDAYNRPAIKTTLDACAEPGWARSVGDVSTGDPRWEIREPERVFEADRYYEYELDPAGDALRRELRRWAGA